MGPELAVAIVRELCGSASCYAAPNGGERPRLCKNAIQFPQSRTLEFCSIMERCGAEFRMNRHAQLQRNALSDRFDPNLHPLLCSLPVKLPAPQRDHGRARRVGRPFVDQPVDDSFSAAHRENSPETQASGRGQVAHG